MAPRWGDPLFLRPTSPQNPCKSLFAVHQALHLTLKGFRRDFCRPIIVPPKTRHQSQTIIKRNPPTCRRSHAPSFLSPPDNRLGGTHFRIAS
ncbi:hypothetical protein CDAR_589241 [Caerostris darwini]|uniref:Uncharacterized protein n=1 Tax=Caerostris darwini TaxID=1538125 RepID=A0AAV4T6E9_9ARAC|nr:hypothetical protein CDAR_589241 [Caerostris darwini]